jgi:UDP-N-acetylmuramoyl-L-alanyl-D-glutamate--2,6-diaminopimelate ligase
MKLAQLLSLFPQLRLGDAASLEVGDITQDSRKTGPGTVFVAIRGNAADGHRFLPEISENNRALALVVEDDAGISKKFKGAVVKVPNTRRALDQLAMRFYGNPASSLFCIGVTGTNGKTTITYMIEKILNHFGWPTGVIGTINHHLLSHKWGSQLTTPDPLTLHRRLKEFVSLGARAAAFEVSSHALDQARVESLPFSVGVFTNFTRDHLDYHGTMEKYFAAKERLFAELLPQGGTAVLNGDDPAIRKTRVKEGVTAWWYGQKQPADFLFRILKQDLNGSLFHLSTPRGTAEIRLPTTGEHNIYNAVAAVAAALAAGCSLHTAGEALAGFYGAPGRLEKVPNDRGLHVFVDYAHTDDAVRTVLRALAQLKGPSSARIVTVFGCGGDRDKGKRPLMCKAACEFSDVIVITSDNPRTEDPLQIIEDVKTGIPAGWKGEVKVEADRKKALGLSLQSAREGDVILVAGKGHEDYQIVGDKKLDFSDVKVLTELL